MSCEKKNGSIWLSIVSIGEYVSIAYTKAKDTIDRIFNIARSKSSGDNEKTFIEVQLLICYINQHLPKNDIENQYHINKIMHLHHSILVKSA